MDKAQSSFFDQPFLMSFIFPQIYMYYFLGDVYAMIKACLVSRFRAILFGAFEFLQMLGLSKIVLDFVEFRISKVAFEMIADMSSHDSN